MDILTNQTLNNPYIDIIALFVIIEEYHLLYRSISKGIKMTKLYGRITPDMDDFGIIRARLQARLEEMGYPAYEANNTAGFMALMLESAEYTDDQLLAADESEFHGIVCAALGHPDHDFEVTLKEAYGKV